MKLYVGHLNVWKTLSTPVFVHHFSSIIQFKDRVYVVSQIVYVIIYYEFKSFKFNNTTDYSIKMLVIKINVTYVFKLNFVRFCIIFDYEWSDEYYIELTMVCFLFLSVDTFYSRQPILI